MSRFGSSPNDWPHPTEDTPAELRAYRREQRAMVRRKRIWAKFEEMRLQDARERAIEVSE